MRVVACADLHLDLPFCWASSSSAARLRRGIRSSLVKAAQVAEEERADVFLLAGDIYEHDRAGLDTAQFLARVLGELTMPVLVAPGNHDHCSPDSIWATTKWASNVRVFDEPCFRPEQLSPQFTIWGAAHLQPANTAGFFDDGFEVEGDGLHLGLFHGSERSALALEDKQKMPHAPFSSEQISRAGMTHAVVGHYHLARAGSHHTYPGTPSFQSFSSPTAGVVVLDFDDGGLIERRWLVVDELKSYDLTLDVTGHNDASSVRVAFSELLSSVEGLARVTLIGDLHPDIELDLRDLAVDLAALDEVIVRSEVRAGYDLVMLGQEASVRGEFIRRVQSTSSLSEAERSRVLVTGLRALDGRVDLEVI